MNWNYCMSYIIFVSHLCKPLKYCNVKTHISTKNKSFSWPSNKPWCDRSGQAMWATLFSSEVHVCLCPPQANDQKQRGASTSSQSTSLTQALMEWGVINHFQWEKQQDLGGAVSSLEELSFLEEVFPQLGWGARRSQAGRTNSALKARSICILTYEWLQALLHCLVDGITLLSHLPHVPPPAKLTK